VPAYIVTTTGAVSDPDAYAAYVEKATPTLETFGGKVLVAGAPVEQLEGSWRPDQTVFVLEFPSVEQAKEWYSSPEYSSARKLREGAIPVHQVLVAALEG
jgi:uncharacterized protein (DUF1330 family)